MLMYKGFFILASVIAVAVSGSEPACQGDKCGEKTVVPTMVASMPETPTQHSPIIGNVENKDKPPCGCIGEAKCPCWKKATMIDKLPEPNKEEKPKQDGGEVMKDVPEPKKEEPKKEEPWQKPKMVNELLPDVKKTECDCKSQTIVPKKCGCKKLQTPCGCQSCPCLKVEDPDIVKEKDMPCLQARFKSLRSGAKPVHCGGKRL